MGLLDSLFGNADQTQALSLLGQGLMQRNAAGGFGAASSLLAQAPARALQQKLLLSQIAENEAQAGERQQKLKSSQAAQERMDKFMFGDPASRIDQGAYSAGPEGVGPTIPMGAQMPQSGGVMGIARALGIPEAAIQADFATNGGKGIAKMLFDRGIPNMDVSNGYAYDKNKVSAGYLPQLNVARDGQTSMVQIGQDGMPVVSAPQGAYPTYAGYKDIEQRSSARYQPETVTPAGQAPQMTTRLTLADTLNGGAPGQTRIPAQVQASRDVEATAIKQAELTKAQDAYTKAVQSGDVSAMTRAQGDIEALNRELGGRRNTVGMPVQSEAEKLRAKTGVEGDAKINEARAADVKTAQRFLSVTQQAEDLLRTGNPTASGMGSLVDKGGAFFGKSPAGAQSARQLDALGGWLTANVPRMEGPQSNFDVGNYMRMAGDVGNPNIPTDQRLAALESIKGMMGAIVGTGGRPGQDDGTTPIPNLAPHKQSSISKGGWSATLKK